MTDTEKIQTLKVLLGIPDGDESEDTRLTTFLQIAKNEILAWRYSNSQRTVTEVPARYEMTQIYAVLEGFSQIGAEGEIAHTEDKVHREFKREDMIAYIRTHVTQIVRVL